MSWYDPNIGTVRVSAVLDALIQPLAASADLQGYLEGPDRIYRQRRRGDDTHALVVRQETTPGGSSQTFSLHRGIRIQASAFCPVDANDPDKWHEAVQDEVYEQWAGRLPSVPEGRVIQPLHRVQRSDAPYYDKERGQYSTVTTWLLVVSATTSLP